MHRLYALFFMLCAPALAQFSSVAAHITYGSALPAHCKTGTGDIFFKTVATIGPYYCSATDTWTFFGTAGGGGAVNGPGSSSDNAVALWDGTSGTLLKNSSLLFDGTTLSGAPTISTGDGTVAGGYAYYELSANGSNFRKQMAPDTLTADLTLKFADALPVTQNIGVGQVQRYPTPSSNISLSTWGSVSDNIRAIGIAFDGGGSALTAPSTAYITVPYACTIAAWNITATPAGSATIDVWKIATGTAVPTISNTITASAVPAISTGTAIHSTTLTSWTTTVAANDILAFNMSAVATSTFVSMVLQCNQ